MLRAAIQIDVFPVGLVKKRDDLGPQFPEGFRRHAVGRAVGAVEDDFDAFQSILIRKGVF